MEGPLLVLKSWLLTALAIWVYKRWFQRVAPPSPAFERFCSERPVVAALHGPPGFEAQAAQLLSRKLGKASAGVATLGGFPWTHYRLALAIVERPGVVAVQVVRGEVLRTRDRNLPALATLVQSALNELPEATEAWLHTGAFNNGLVAPPAGGWALQRGHERRPRLVALAQRPERLLAAAESAPRASAGYLALENQTPWRVPYGTA